MEPMSRTNPQNLASGSTATPNTTNSNDASVLANATASVHAAIDQAALKAQPAIESIASMAHQATDKVSSSGEQTAEWVTAQSEQLAAVQKKAVDGTCEYICANPLKSVGMALLAGFLISRVVR